MKHNHYVNDGAPRLSRLLVLMMVIAGCVAAPDFGEPIPGAVRRQPEKIWFPQLPGQYAVKHLVSMKLDAAAGRQEQDWLAYLLVKNRDFRLLAMNELGMTLFDLYAAANKPVMLVKPSPVLANATITANLVQDIRQVFLGRSLLTQTAVDHYRSAAGGYTLVQRPAPEQWCAWESADGQPQRIRCGHGTLLEKSITFDYRHGHSDFGFPKKITIHYHQTGLTIVITLLAITARDIPAAQLIPRS